MTLSNSEEGLLEMDQKTGVILVTLKVFESCFVKGISMIGVMNMGRRASALFHSPRGNKKKKSKDATGRPTFKQDFIKFTGNTLNAHCCITIRLFFSKPRETKYCIIRTYNLFIPLCHVNTSTFADFLCKGWQQSQSYLASFIYSDLSKVVQEYERAVIFRLGRLRRGGAKVFHTRFLFAAHVLEYCESVRRVQEYFSSFPVLTAISVWISEQSHSMFLLKRWEARDTFLAPTGAQ